jgi:hypothetical protein
MRLPTPTVSAFARWPLETERLRRRLQAESGEPLSELLRKALEALARERSLSGRQRCSDGGRPTA